MNTRIESDQTRPSVTRSEARCTTLRIRFVRLPRPGEFDEYDLSRFLIGEVYDVPAQLASLLILSEYAAPVPFSPWRDVATDPHRPRKP